MELISREQAIDALEKWLHSLFGITEADGTATIFKTIRQLPPIQPDSCSEFPNNSDAISRQAAIDALRKLREEDIEDYGCEIPEGFNQDHLDRATFAIKQLPPIQPKRGKWLPDNNNYIYEQYVCSECKNSFKVDTCMGKPMWNFCPNCGADMREKGENNESN